MRTAVIIPARYSSTRLPGKPLAIIGGKTMLERVCAIAREAVRDEQNAQVLVTTEDTRIQDEAKRIGVHCVLTPASAPTGSDRVLMALRQLDEWPDFVVNLQADRPFMPPEIVRTMIREFQKNNRLEVVTPVHRLQWDELDRLREAKKTEPFSGTTVVLDKRGKALWFSKQILPAIRNEDALRKTETLSPVHQHMGLYGFRVDILEKFVDLPQTEYECCEGLEQLRMLGNGISVQTVPVDIDLELAQFGIDTLEDLRRAEKLLQDRNSRVA